MKLFLGLLDRVLHQTLFFFCLIAVIIHFNPRYGFHNKETWTVVTGSAMGIGKAYCLELAKMGFNVIMMDKDDNQMEKTKLEITALGVKVEIIHDITFVRLYCLT